MFRNYLALAIRSLLRNKLVSLINICGLSIALAFGILAVALAHHEWTYDLFHVNVDRIYRICQRTGDQLTSRTPWPLGPAIAEGFPDANVVRVYRAGGSIAHGQNSFRVGISYVDPSFLDVFSFPIMMGDASDALQDVGSIVITEKVARRLFAGANPVGKFVTINEKEAYTVTAVLSRLPDNSSIVFDCLLHADAGEELLKSRVSVSAGYLAAGGAPGGATGRFSSSVLWMFQVVTTYLIAPEYLEPRDIKERLAKVVQKARGREATTIGSLSLQPLNEVHFDQHTRGFEPAINPLYIYIFLGIALIVITISCVNYSGLAMGSALLRAKEAGVRRLFGARRRQLVFQYLVESVLLALLALVVGMGLMVSIMPSLQSLIGTRISMYGQLSVLTSSYAFLLTMAIGMLAGLYPALALSRLQPVEVLEARFASVNPGFLMRLLLFIQFAMSMVLTMGALAMAAQLDLLANKNPGFRTDGVIVVETGRLRETSPGLLDVYEKRIASYPNIIGVAGGQHPLSNKQRLRGFLKAEGKKVKSVENIAVDYDFLNTLEFTMLEGRDFSRLYSTDRDAVIVNQALMKQFGWQSVKNKVVEWGGEDVPIIGAVRDFHFRSFHHQVAPAIIFLGSECCNRLFVVSSSNDDFHVIETLRKEWHKVAPYQPFRARFLEDDLKNQYKKDEKWLIAIQLPAILALGLACLGAFGLTSFSVARRTQEIGIRKVLGTTIPRLMARLSIDFLKVVILATLIAGPIAYLVLREWLQNFVYRINLNEPIITGAVLTFAFVMLAVSYKTYRAATANPANTLRRE